MDAKQKAYELVEKFIESTLIFDDRGGWLEDKNEAKNCAKICVNEILNNFGQLTDGANFYTSYDAIKYYQQVKEEIEKL